MKQKIITMGLASLLSLTACSKHNYADEPNAKLSLDEATRATHTIAELKALYQNKATLISQDVVVEATVVSDDTEGNLYRTAFIQDDTGGIELKLSLGNLSTMYPQGSRVLLKARGMTLGQYGGQVNLGYASTNERYETSFYPEKLVPKVLRMRSLGSVSAKATNLSAITPSMQGQLIRLDGVQFISSELGLTYAAAGSKDKQANVNRTLVDRSGKQIVVRTSSYAKFAGKTLPEGSGSFTGILTFFNRTPQLLLLREQDAQLHAPRF